jgi:serine/threonine protein kinase/tetratricopeptide (TPR) repeat protein
MRRRRAQSHFGTHRVAGPDIAPPTTPRDHAPNELRARAHASRKAGPLLSEPHPIALPLLAPVVSDGAKKPDQESGSRAGPAQGQTPTASSPAGPEPGDAPGNSKPGADTGSDRGEDRNQDRRDGRRGGGGGDDDDSVSSLSEVSRFSQVVGKEDEHTAVGRAVALRPEQAITRGSLLSERYQIEQRLGEGGSGTVYRAWDRLLAELVAVKVLHPQRARERSWIRRLAREVKIARAIRHPNICRVFELGHAGQHWFVTMELATGGSLRDALRAARAEADDEIPLGESGIVAAAAAATVTTTATTEEIEPAKTPEPVPIRPLAERLADIRALGAGLAAIHAMGFTHRDVTPQNVLRMADGRLVLTDFGLAIERDDQTTVHGGTPAYLPPEVARGERSDQRSDVFQLGMVMHEVLCGRRPIWSADGTRMELAEADAGDAAANAAVEEALLALIADCVHADPTRRPPSAVTVAGRLATVEATRPAALPLRLVARVRRIGRRHPRLLQVGAAALALALVVRTVQVLSRPPLCLGAEQQLAGIWDPSRAEAVRRAFLATGKSHAAETFTRTGGLLDAYARSWKAMYTDACEATHKRGEQSEDVLDLRMSCLQRQRGELRAVTDLFSSADGDLLSHAISAVAELPAVGRCADVPLLRAVVQPPDSAEMRASVERMRQRVAEVKALSAAGRYKDGLARAQALVAEARALGYSPLLAEALHALGRTQTFAGAPEAAPILEEAMLLAESSRHDRVLAEAAVDQVSLLYNLRRPEDLRRFVPRAEATVKRLGGDQLLESWIQTAVGGMLDFEGNWQAALAAHQQALDLKLKVLARDDPDVARSLGNVANELHLLGRNAEALIANERTVAIMQKAFGDSHPVLAMYVHNRGEVRLALGRPEEARQDFERVLAIWRDELPADHMYISYPLTGIGLSHLAAGEAAAAVPFLERALVIRDRGDPPAEGFAETAFALARALWETGRDHDRARVLAERARLLVPPGRTEERRRIEQALASWGSAEPKPSGGARKAKGARDR